MKHIKGDLIALAKAGEFDVIVHGCNCFCAMGAGIAKQIAREWPESLAADRKTKRGDGEKLGTFTWTVAPGGLVIINAYTQYHYGGIGPRVQQVHYGAVSGVMARIKRQYSDKRIGMPMIGAGLGGGDWPTIEKIIAVELENCDVTIVEYEK